MPSNLDSSKLLEHSASQNGKGNRNVLWLALLLGMFLFSSVAILGLTTSHQLSMTSGIEKSSITHEYVSDRFLFFRPLQRTHECNCPKQVDSISAGVNQNKAEATQVQNDATAFVQGNNIHLAKNNDPAQSLQTNFDLLYRKWPNPYQLKKQSVNLKDLEKREREWTQEQWADELHQVVRRNTINESNTDYLILTVSNIGIGEMTMNWAASLLANKFTKFVVLCFDFRLYTLLWEYGLGANAAMVPTLWTNTTVLPEHATWASQNYNNLLLSKMIVLQKFTDMNIHVLFSDVDIVFLSPFVLKHMIFETLHTNTDMAYMVDNSIGNPDVINSGFILIQPTRLMWKVLDRSVSLMKTDPKLTIDQMALNYVIEKELKLKFTRHIRPLDKTLYPSGWTLKRKHKNEDFLVFPMVAHFNWIAHTTNKQKYMKQVNMWYVGDMFSNLS